MYAGNQHSVPAEYSGRDAAVVALNDPLAVYYEGNQIALHVWRRVKGELKPVHIHGSHAQDISLDRTALAVLALTADSSLFDSLRRFDPQGANREKLAIRDTEDRHRLLFPDKILFLQATVAYTAVHTETDRFRVSGVLYALNTRLPPRFNVSIRAL